MIGWNLDKMSDVELIEKYNKLVNAQIYRDRFPELVENLRLMRNYMRVRLSVRKKDNKGSLATLPNIMSAGMKY